MDPYTWWMHGFPWMWIFPLTGLIIAVIFLAMFLRGAGPFCRGDRDEARRETPRQILDRRYASGEITQEQYEEMKRNIER